MPITAYTSASIISDTYSYKRNLSTALMLHKRRNAQRSYIYVCFSRGEMDLRHSPAAYDSHNPKLLRKLRSLLPLHASFNRPLCRSFKLKPADSGMALYSDHSEDNYAYSKNKPTPGLSRRQWRHCSLCRLQHVYQAGHYTRGTSIKLRQDHSQCECDGTAEDTWIHLSRPSSGRPQANHHPEPEKPCRPVGRMHTLGQ